MSTCICDWLCIDPKSNSSFTIATSKPLGQLKNLLSTNLLVDACASDNNFKYLVKNFSWPLSEKNLEKIKAEATYYLITEKWRNIRMSLRHNNLVFFILINRKN